MLTISDTLLKAISWTLVHSIWQGFILAFLTGILIMNTKKSSSFLRYNLLSTLFLSFIFFVGFTFNYEFQNENEQHIKSLNFSIKNLDAIWTVENNRISNQFSSLVIDFLNQNANTIVMIWFIIFCIKCFGITSNLSQIYRIRNYRNQLVSDYWKEKLAQLAQKINLNKEFTLLESQLIKVPSVTGFFKPIILLPIGLLSNLPQYQIEAILLHELAHIKRKDYFVNIIQSFAEILFFFNPGLLWVSKLIKEERENCCDDIAISATQSKSNFVNALVSFQEYNLKSNDLLMGFGGKENHLLNRAKRIINNDTRSLTIIEKSVVSLAFFTVTSMMFLFGNATLPESKEPQKSSLKHKNKIAQINNFDKNATVETNNYYVNENQIIKELDAQAAMADEKAKIAQKQKIKAEAVRKINKTETKSTTTYEKTTVTTTDNKAKVTEKVVVNADNYGELDDNLTNLIINDLADYKIISEKKNLSYSLSKTKLVVNGILQSDSIHAKFKNKYLNFLGHKNSISDNISINYNYEISNLVACN